MNERQLFTRLIGDLRAQKWTISLGLFLYFPLTLLNIMQPVLIGYAVSHGILSGSLGRVWIFAGAFFSVVVLLAAVELGQGICLQLAGQRFVEQLRQRAFDKVQRLHLGFLDKTPLGKILTRLTNDAESVAELFSMGAIQIVGDLLFLCCTFVMLFFVHVKLTFYSMLMLPFLLLGLSIFRVLTRRAFVSVRGVLSNLNAFLQEYFSGLATIQMSGRLDDAYQEFRLFNQQYLKANRQAVFLEAAIFSFVDALSYCTSALVVWGAFEIGIGEALSLGVVVAFLDALSRFFQPLRELSNRYAIFQSAMVSLERIYELFSWPEEHDVVSEKKSVFSSAVDFRHVGFKYDRGENVLHDINFSIKKGEHVALVGHTGAGKSTVIKLLNRFYPVTTGVLLIDGKNINDMALGDVRTLVSVVPQEVFLFHGTVKENLTFAKQDASDEELWQALSAVQMDATVRERGGLMAVVEPKGLNFSLGERQLFAFARALIANPPIIVLDEATASVDARTEQRLHQATKELLKNRTALIIAHRLSTITDAHRILVFDKGHIVEEGTHSSLLEHNGLYAQYVNLQRRARPGK